MARTKLNDEHWHKLFIILRQINVYNKPNLRRTVEGMLYRIRVGCPWRDLPSYFGHWSSIYHQYRYWRKTGKWQKLMKIVTANYDSEWLFIDGSVVKALSIVQAQPVILMRPLVKALQVIAANCT